MCENKGVKIGIVIPIYNVAPYLRECLDLVVNQTYKNFHAVLVNDGSSDDSLKIALEYVAKDSRFVLIDKENGGQSSARNAGIDYFNGEMESSLLDSAKPSQICNIFRHTERSEVSKSHEYQTNNKSVTKEQISISHRFAQSQQITNDSRIAKMDSSLRATRYAQNDESMDSPILSQKDEEFIPKIDYIIFLDSDDFWAVDLLEKCVDSVRIAQQSNQNLDIVWFDWNEIYVDSGRIQGKTTMELFGFATQTQITARQWLIQAQEKRINSFWWAWQGLIDFDYLRRVNLRFLEGVIFEDNLFGVLLFSQCESIAIVPCKLYNYRIRKHSTTNNSAKSLPPFVADLRAHFSTDSEAWAYFCAYSLCAMSLEFANFCANLSEKNRAKPREYGESKLCESIFLPNFLAESCDILAFSSDPLNAKSRFIALLKERGKYAPYLKIIAHIVPRGFKRLRYALFLFYFAPQFAFFRALRKISRALGFGDG